LILRKNLSSPEGTGIARGKCSAGAAVNCDDDEATDGAVDLGSLAILSKTARSGTKPTTAATAIMRGSVPLAARSSLGRGGGTALSCGVGAPHAGHGVVNELICLLHCEHGIRAIEGGAFEHRWEIQSYRKQLDGYQHRQRAFPTTTSHGSLDGQRDDRLGGETRFLWWKILCERVAAIR
jgi:hypothetical protein